VLSQPDIAPYLVDAGLIGKAAVANRAVRVRDVSRRNSVFIATAEGSPAFVLKQARSPADSAIAREATVLRALASLREPVGLGEVVPRLVAYDEGHQVLVLEATPEARDLRRHFAPGRLSTTLAGAAGRALALLHSVPLAATGPRPGSLDLTWLLSWHRPRLEDLSELSAVSIELLRMTQASKVMCESLDELRESWRPASQVHGDSRWENWIAVPASRSRRWNRLLLVDWELAGDGDPCLDVGAFFGEYLLAWLESIPVIDGREPGRLAHHARVPLGRIQPSLRSFWHAYVEMSRANGTSHALVRSVRFAAVRLIQAALERARDSSELRAGMVLSLQLAANLLERPREGAERVLGLLVPERAL
jgi:Phosphotransferase enzyme family